MVVEFERFGLLKFRRLTGALELLGGLGLMVSLVYPPLAILAAGGLALLMVLGVATRIRVKDSLASMAPAIFLLALNLAILAFALQSRSL